MLSIIIPCFNAARFLERTLTVACQYPGPLEIVVVDDGSTDDTAVLVQNYNSSKIRYLYQDNAGVSVARNSGLAASKGTSIVFLDGDDLLDIQVLIEAVQVLEQAPEIGAVVGEYARIDENDQIISQPVTDNTSHTVTSQEALISFLKHYQKHHLSAIVWRRSTVAQLTFDPEIAYGEDQDFLIRGLANCSTVMLVSRILLLYRKHDHSALRKPYNMARAGNILKFIERLDNLSQSGVVPSGNELDSYKVALFLMEINAATASHGPERAEAIRLLARSIRLKSLRPQAIRAHHWIMIGSVKWLPLNAYRLILRLFISLYALKGFTQGLQVRLKKSITK